MAGHAKVCPIAKVIPNAGVTITRNRTTQLPNCRRLP